MSEQSFEVMEIEGGRYIKMWTRGVPVEDDDVAATSTCQRWARRWRPTHHELLVSADHSEVIEGSTPLPRTVLIRFDSHDSAMDWYNSAAY
jgi:hypothetical protein